MRSATTVLGIIRKHPSSDVSELESVLHRKVHGAFGARPTEKGCIHSTSLAAYATYNLMEGTLEVLVVNAAHMKNVPGRKTDVKDAEWIADLLRLGFSGQASSPTDHSASCAS